MLKLKVEQVGPFVVQIQSWQDSFLLLVNNFLSSDLLLPCPSSPTQSGATMSSSSDEESSDESDASQPPPSKKARYHSPSAANTKYVLPLVHFEIELMSVRV